MSQRPLLLLLIFVVHLCCCSSSSRDVIDDYLRLPSDRVHEEYSPRDPKGTRWAILIAGSNGYWNYRHQADVCHAYQVLRKGGLKEENIVVFMYDDIAFNEENPNQGVIINNPLGDDVYAGVPKDYTGDQVTADNLFAVILGNKSALSGGSGKVVGSGPDDHIFIFYSDHGGPGVLGMPTYPFVYACDLIEVLKKKHASGTYQKMVFYLEACESGSIFEGLLPEDINVYATTAANAEESSWGTYCPGDIVAPPPEYDTCLGDLYSVAWMEDSDARNLRRETLHEQYQLVKRRTANENVGLGSHVMRYGDMSMKDDYVYLYMGTNPANDNSSNHLRLNPSAPVNQRDADLIHFWSKYRNSPEGSQRKMKAGRQFMEAMTHRMHVDHSMQLVANLIFGVGNSSDALSSVRPAGQPLVDDWNCLKTMVRIYEEHCGALSQYGMKHMRFLANICNYGITAHQMLQVSSQACPSFPSGHWSSIQRGFSA